MRHPSYQISADLLHSVIRRLTGDVNLRDGAPDPHELKTNAMLAHMLGYLIKDQDREEGEAGSFSRLSLPLALSEEEQRLKDELLEDTRKRFTKLTMRPDRKKADAP